MYPDATPSRNSVQAIQASVATRYGITIDDLVSGGRAARVAWPRQVAMHLARELTHASLNDIGAAFGGRNHATIIHACKRVADRVNDDPDAAADLAELTSSLG